MNKQDEQEPTFPSTFPVDIAAMNDMDETYEESGDLAVERLLVESPQEEAQVGTVVLASNNNGNSNLVNLDTSSVPSVDAAQEQSLSCGHVTRITLPHLMTYDSNHRGSEYFQNLTGIMDEDCVNLIVNMFSPSSTY